MLTFYHSWSLSGSIDRTTMIGAASEFDRLYYLNDNATSSTISVFLVIKCSFLKLIIWILWHKRLGNPNFKYMSRMFPSICSKKDISQFYCEIWELAKHCHSTFQSIPYRASNPFTTIFGVHRMFQIVCIQNGLSPSSMIIPGELGLSFFF